MVHTVIENAKGSKINSKVYVVDGFQPEPLLGDNDAEQLGFITFQQGRKEPKNTRHKCNQENPPNDQRQPVDTSRNTS